MLVMRMRVCGFGVPGGSGASTAGAGASWCRLRRPVGGRAAGGGPRGPTVEARARVRVPPPPPPGFAPPRRGDALYSEATTAATTSLDPALSHWARSSGAHAQLRSPRSAYTKWVCEHRDAVGWPSTSARHPAAVAGYLSSQGCPPHRIPAPTRSGSRGGCCWSPGDTASPSVIGAIRARCWPSSRSFDVLREAGAERGRFGWVRE